MTSTTYECEHGCHITINECEDRAMMSLSPCPDHPDSLLIVQSSVYIAESLDSRRRDQP